MCSMQVQLLSGAVIYAHTERLAVNFCDADYNQNSQLFSLLDITYYGTSNFLVKYTKNKIKTTSD